jgi:hypothetical protein
MIVWLCFYPPKVGLKAPVQFSAALAMMNFAVAGWAYSSDPARVIWATIP